jgi:hypothetical protein
MPEHTVRAHPNLEPAGIGIGVFRTDMSGFINRCGKLRRFNVLPHKNAIISIQGVRTVERHSAPLTQDCVTRLIRVWAAQSYEFGNKM